MITNDGTDCHRFETQLVLVDDTLLDESVSTQLVVGDDLDRLEQTEILRQRRVQSLVIHIPSCSFRQLLVIPPIARLDLHDRIKMSNKCYFNVN